MYVDQMKSYRKNRHEMAPEMEERIHKEWSFAFTEWGYEKVVNR
jgi:hypothetical protein